MKRIVAVALIGALLVLVVGIAILARKSPTDRLLAELDKEHPDRHLVEELVPGVIAALSDGDHWVRADAAAALGRCGDPRAVPPLISALDDKDLLYSGDII